MRTITSIYKSQLHYLTIYARHTAQKTPRFDIIPPSRIYAVIKFGFNTSIRLA